MMTNEQRRKLFEDVVTNAMWTLIRHPHKILEDVSSEVRKGAHSLLETVDDALLTIQDYLQSKDCWQERAMDQQPTDDTPPADTTKPPETLS